MAGWSRIAVLDDDGSSLKNQVETKPCLDLEPGPNGLVKIEQKGDNEKKIKCLFVELLTLLYKEVYGNLVYRPLPSMPGDDEVNVDLLRFYLVVREHGGYEEVSKTRSWGLVAKECGISSRFVAGLKVVYVKYLNLLDRRLHRIVNKGDNSWVLKKMSNFSEVSMNLESGLEGLLSEILDQKKKNGECFREVAKRELEFKGDGKLCNGDGDLERSGGMENVDEVKVVEDGKQGGFEKVELNRSADINDLGSFCDVSEGKSVVYGQNDDTVSESSTVKENELGRKRKRECFSSTLLKWITEVAKDPGEPAIGSFPERSKWSSSGNEHLWKQLLLVRESMFLKRNADSSARQLVWQNKPMHPAMYEDPILRCSPRVASAKQFNGNSRRRTCLQSSSSATDEDHFGKMSDSTADSTDALWVHSHRQKRALVGPNFQADVPEWDKKVQESDSKWLGTRMWPLEAKEQNNYLIERDRIGKGRQDSCGCQFPASLECVRFHIAEKRKRVKLELGVAFYHWKFENMGEKVSVSWTRVEEKKFQDIVRSNPLSMEKCFWNELVKVFPRRDKKSLVNYYFNVFLLRRRGHQNRTTPSNIDSDDDEAELGSKAVNHPPGSIFCSPKKDF